MRRAYCISSIRSNYERAQKCELFNHTLILFPLFFSFSPLSPLCLSYKSREGGEGLPFLMRKVVGVELHYTFPSPHIQDRIKEQKSLKRGVREVS